MDSALHSLVPSLETCEALAVTGFPQDAPLAWYHYLKSGPHVDLARAVAYRICAAPTLAEVLAVLPFWIPFRDYDAGWSLHLADLGGFVAHYVLDGSALMEDRVALQEQLCFDHENAAEAAAQLYLALHAAGLLPVQP